MKTHMMTLDDTHFNDVKLNKKKYEIRIFDEKRQTLLLGDTIVFKHKNSDETLEKKVIQLLLFDTFRDALRTMNNFSEVLPNNSLDEGINLYETLPHAMGNYKIASEKYGIVVIKLE
jgi:ASC-1-like (ASCH) protein